MIKEIKKPVSGTENGSSHFQLPHDAKGRIRWSIAKADTELLGGWLEQECEPIFQEHQDFSHPLLRKLKRNDILEALRHYPGGFYRLAEEVGVKPKKKPKGFWTVEKIEAEAAAIVREHGQLNPELLVSIKRVDLLGAMVKQYPGGTLGLKAKLGMESKAKPAGYWTAETIKQEARQVINEHGKISYNFLIKLGRADLIGALRAHYPGGLVQLKKDLGIQSEQKPVGYWTIERIEEEARSILETQHDLSYNFLFNQGRSDLLNAISSHYPGGLKSLKIKFGATTSKKEAGFWSRETTEQEARKFIAENGSITHVLLRQKGRRDLSHAVAKFPGMLDQLKTEAVDDDEKRWWGYWTIERIEEEVKAFYAREKTLRRSAFRRSGAGGLYQAIHAKYPGGMKALRTKLEVTENTSVSVTKDQANDDLDSLFKGAVNE
jgi:hypothetical protein